VTVRYGEVVAVDRLSLEVAAGEVVALLGPSGCGKSSALRAIAGLEPVAGGSITFAGRDLAGVPVHQRDLGLMFQDHALFPNLDVAGNIAFGLRMHRWARPRIEARVGELLELVDLVGFGRRSVAALSGGEAQRVALARALAPEPQLLILDEPLGALDRGLREQLTRDVRGLLKQLGQTALHVTHDQAEAFALADRVAVLRAGRLVQIGEPADLWHRPVDAFVARFLGHTNIWAVAVGSDGDVGWGGVVLGRMPSGSVAGVVDGAAAGAGGAPAGAAPPGEVELLVPVTAIRLAATGPIEGVVELVELREGTARVTVGTRAGPAVVQVESPPRVGDAVRLSVDLARCTALIPHW
jgi:thiamine transport system ATP-binding protein